MRTQAPVLPVPRKTVHPWACAQSPPSQAESCSGEGTGLIDSSKLTKAEYFLVPRKAEQKGWPSTPLQKHLYI